MRRKLLEIFSERPSRLFMAQRIGSVAELSCGAKILEIGCGDGQAAAYMAEQGFVVTGLDIDPSQIKKAKLNLETERLKFLCADAEKLHFEKGHFDAIICEASFSSIKNKKAAAAEFYRVLRPEGLLLVSDYVLLGTKALRLETIPAAIAGTCTETEYNSIFSSAGFVLEGTIDASNTLLSLLLYLRIRLGISVKQVCDSLCGENVKLGYKTMLYRKTVDDEYGN